ncbi:glycoside hydrolase family 3 C-terminal domain-containing protein [Nakamurella sp. GG22]
MANGPDSCSAALANVTATGPAKSFGSVGSPTAVTHPDQESSTDYAHLIETLDLPAKVRLLTGGDVFTLAPEPSIGLRTVALSDGPTGVRGLKFSGGRTVSLFPNATLLASAWSEDTAYEVGTLLAEEAMAQGVHVVLGPTINLHRSLLGGRLFEAYSEDPLLTGKLAAAYVRGLQSSGVGACLKHLIANESETARNNMNSVVDETTLRELYLLPFEIAVEESGPWSIMAAYNDVNGVAATEQHHVQNQIVKDEWGFDGVIMSDWFATKTTQAASGGLDLVMPGPAGPWGGALVQAVRAGEVDEDTINDHLRRILRLADRVGALGAEREHRADLPAPDSKVRKEQLTRLAAEGITVLTNKDSALPLAQGIRVALIGRHALETIDMGGGSAQVNPPYQVSTAEGLTALLGDAVTVTDGVEVRTRQAAARTTFVTDPETGQNGTHAWIYAADGSLLDHRHLSEALVHLGFDDNYPAPIDRVVLRAKLAATGDVELGVIGKGSWTVRNGEQRTEFEVTSAATGFGDDMLAPPTCSEVVTVNPTGVVEIELRVTGRGTGLDSTVTVGLIARVAARDQDQAITEAAAAAADADVAVVVVGLTEEQETEAVDKSTLNLTGRQDDLVRAVAASARRTVVVVNSATPVIMPWIDDVDAVLWAGLPGQEGGHAIAAALLGHIEPAGRLVTTFPTADGNAPAWNVTPVDGNLEYSEGTAIGYRGHYAGAAPAPAFWLGHGLGYSTWEYVAAHLVQNDAPHAVSVTIRNTGNRTSREVVQVYYRPREVDQPIRLVGWQATTVEPAATSTVTVVPDTRMWRAWNTTTNTWDHLTGGGELLVARGLGDIRATINIP